jgi:hypothetical protein
MGRGSTLICIPFANMYLFGEWEFEDAGEVMLCGPLSGVSGDWFFDVDVTRSLPL